MIVSCPSCAARFNVPDAKISGKRARMKCKKCGTFILINGPRSEAPSSSPHSQTPPSRPRSSPHGSGANEPAARSMDISPRWRIQDPSGRRVEVTLDRAAQLYAEGRIPRGSFVCAPGKTQWLAPSQFPELERRAGRPAPAPRPPLPTYTEETVSLGAAETEVLKLQSRVPQRVVASARPETGFFDQNDVEAAMVSFDHLRDASSPSTPPSAPSPPGTNGRAIAPPAPRISAQPPPIPAHLVRGGAATSGGLSPAMSQAAAPQSVWPAAPAAMPTAQPTVAYPARHAYPAQPLTPISSYPPPPDPAASYRRISTPYPVAPLPSGFSAPLGAELDNPFRQKKSTGWLWAVALLIGLGAAGTTIDLYRPTWIATARAQALQLVEKIKSRKDAVTLPSGPEFDTAAAGQVLGAAALSVRSCSAPRGPVGKGRARVLFEPSGKAIEVAVSEPFHQTQVGRCVMDGFLKARVPAFGGQPVIVNKTFEIK